MRRLDNESFEDYKLRRASLNQAVKLHMKGHYVYSHPIDQRIEDPITGEITWKRSKKIPFHSNNHVQRIRLSAKGKMHSVLRLQKQRASKLQRSTLHNQV